MGNERRQAVILDHLGDNHLAVGHRQAAGDTWQQALRIFEDLRCPDAGRVREKLHTLAGGSAIQALPEANLL
jgi:hypothetical protein